VECTDPVALFIWIVANVCCPERLTAGIQAKFARSADEQALLPELHHGTGLLASPVPQWLQRASRRQVLQDFAKQAGER
tara:strand:+ start:1174 stop:1410 length:237 start_codon:yes stop_codon:yes gene_type:complete